MELRGHRKNGLKFPKDCITRHLCNVKILKPLRDVAAKQFFILLPFVVTTSVRVAIERSPSPLARSKGALDIADVCIFDQPFVPDQSVKFFNQ